MGSNLDPFNPFISKNGTQIIRAQPSPNKAYTGAPPSSKGQSYVSGQLTSAHRFTQRYGYYELRAKLPPGKGLWARFWLLTDDGNWPGEYDVFEVLGKEKPVTVHQTTHSRDVISRPGNDDKTYDGIRQDNRVNIPMCALIDLAVGNDPGNLWPGSPDKSNVWPADMGMDDFRVYSNDPSLPRVTLGPGYTPSILPKGITLSKTPPAAVLPPEWTAGDIGSPELKGSSTWNPITGEWMLKSWAFGGQRHFAGKPLTGDGGIIATVQSTTAMNSNEQQ